MNPTKIIPNRFLFKFELPIRRAAKPLKLEGDPTAWGPRFRLPRLCLLDGEVGFGDVYAGWHDSGLFVGCVVRGKARLPRCDAADFRKSDHLRVLTDMRDTRQIRRATRFCQAFYFMPTGGGAKNRDPVAASAEIARAQDDAPFVPPGKIPIAAGLHDDGYTLTAHLPREVLVGYDPVEHSRIGFVWMIEDLELGHQSATVDDDLNWWMDPSTWPTGVLAE